MKCKEDDVSARCLIAHIVCVLSLISAWVISTKLLQWSLVTHPENVLSVLWGSQTLAAMFAFCQIEATSQIFWNLGRSVVSLPIGALVMAVGAILFGAPIGLKFAGRTLHWSLLMSSLTVVPAATIFGSAWREWQRIFAHNKLLEGIDYLLCFPAYGALLGAWFGAWPMPLDWERPWQDWPICVTYGTLAGYLSGLIISAGFNIRGIKSVSEKID